MVGEAREGGSGPGLAPEQGRRGEGTGPATGASATECAACGASSGAPAAATGADAIDATDAKAAPPMTKPATEQLDQAQGAAGGGGSAAARDSPQGPPLFDRIWLCDTCPRGAAAAASVGGPYRVLSVAPLLAQMLPL